MNPVVVALNHLLRQNPWAAEQLRPFAGKTVQLNLSPLAVTLTLIDSGEFVPAIDHPAVDAGITLTPIAALRLLAKREDYSSIALDGDIELATAVGKVLRQLEWEYEEDLSRLLGDIAAHELASLGKRIIGEGRRQFRSVTGMLAEFWQEEQPLLAKQRHVEQFAREVDQLRDDVERLAKRLEKMDRPI